MLKICKFIIIYLFLFFNLSAHSADLKVVYLNLDRIVKSTNSGNLILQKFDKQKKENVEKFKLKENELRDKEQDIIKKKNILSEEEFESKVLALKKEMKKYNEERQNFFLEYEQNKKKKLNEFLVNITPIIETYVKENSINIVLNEKNLFIASRKFDITEQIIKIIDKSIK